MSGQLITCSIECSTNQNKLQYNFLTQEGNNGGIPLTTNTIQTLPKLTKESECSSVYPNCLNVNNWAMVCPNCLDPTIWNHLHYGRHKLQKRCEHNRLGHDICLQKYIGKSLWCYDLWWGQQREFPEVQLTGKAPERKHKRHGCKGWAHVQVFGCGNLHMTTGYWLVILKPHTRTLPFKVTSQESYTWVPFIYYRPTPVVSTCMLIIQ